MQAYLVCATPRSGSTLDGDAHAAVAPMSITFGLADRLDVGRGDVLVAPGDQPVSARELDSTLCWMSEEPLHPGRRYALKLATRTVRATVQEISERTDPETLERRLEATSLAVNDIGRVRLRTTRPWWPIHTRLYARARAGEITGFTGIDAPYEPPEHPELRVDTAVTDVQRAVSQIIEILRTRPQVLAKGATMRISAKADYAVRAAIELAATPHDKAVPAERIATSQGIPLNFLEHILAELRIAGVVRSQRGTDGGYRLAREPGRITIADIIRAVEGPLATVRGGKPEDAEYPGPATQLPRVWIAVRKNLRSVVEHVTVADVANASLPDSINSLADDPEAWVTR